VLYKPEGTGPFPAVIYNHGSAPGMMSEQAFAATMVRLLETDHLDDQFAALAWLRKQSFVQPSRIAVAGNAFGGIETVLGVERGGYCAGIDSAGGAQSWAQAPELQSLMTRAVRNAKAPIFFFQAANDFDLSPSKTLSAEMKEVSKAYKLKIYPPYGYSPRDGHSFGYFGSDLWAEDVFGFLNQHCTK
jgi:dienelactone hydrolase